MFLVMDTSTDKQHYKCKILSHYNMENISVSTFVLLDPVKGKANYFFFRLKKVKKISKMNWSTAYLFQKTNSFRLSLWSNPKILILTSITTFCMCVWERAELSWALAFSLALLHTTTTCLNFVKERYCVGWFITLLSRSPSLFGSTEIEPTKTLL